MKTLLSRLYSLWGVLLFIGLFALFLPFFLLAINIPALRGLGPKLNRIWARSFFMLMALPVGIEYRGQKPGGKGPFVFVANHFSYFDIPTMGLLPYDFVFVGKSSLGKVPLFGYMFRKLHITVDRSNWRDRYETINRSIEALQEGRSLTIFAEGGIYTENPPEMVRFKDGAFRAAIAEQIPVVPVTIPFNWIILPDDGHFLLRWKPQKIVIHEPLPTTGKSAQDLESLKAETFQIIDAEIKQQCHAYRQRNAEEDLAPRTS